MDTIFGINMEFYGVKSGKTKKKGGAIGTPLPVFKGYAQPRSFTASATRCTATR